MKKPAPTALVYSTDTGRHCADCGKAIAACECKQKNKAQVKGKGAVRVRRETAGRGGKTVTTISDVALHKQGLEDLLKSLKSVCGTGGTLKDGVLELQGDHCDKVVAELTKRGHQAKRAGG